MQPSNEDKAMSTERWLLLLGILFLVQVALGSFCWLVLSAGWVGVLGGFMLAQVLFSVILGLEMRFINEHVIRDGNIPSDLKGAISILIYFAAFTAIALEIPNYAATIMSGAPTSAGGAIGGMVKRGLGLHPAMRMARGVAGAGRKLLGRARGNRIS